MGQDNNSQNQVRFISPEEVQRQSQGKQMTPEELQKTQVLNLKDVEEAVKYEKMNSKKPAIIVGIIGILLLTCGTTFQIAKSLKGTESTIEKREVQPNKVKRVDLTKAYSLTCKKLTLNNADGTDMDYTIKYNIQSNKLVSFSKKLIM